MENRDRLLITRSEDVIKQLVPTLIATTLNPPIRLGWIFEQLLQSISDHLLDALTPVRSGDLQDFVIVRGDSKTQLYLWRVIDEFISHMVEIKVRLRLDAIAAWRHNVPVNSNTLAQQNVMEREHKTTLLLPDHLWKRAKKTGVDRGISLRQLLMEGLELRLAQIEGSHE